MPRRMLEDRILWGQLGRQDLIAYAQLNSPAGDDPMNPWKCTKTWKPFHKLIAHHLERLERGEINRLEIETPPRVGKSQLAVREFVPWMLGKKWDRSGIVITHTDTLALEHGRDVRDAMRGPGHNLVFGDNGGRRGLLRLDSQAADRLKVVGGGVVQFSGRSGLGAGLSADWIIFDDFFKNSEEAQSQTVRDSAWHTFISDCRSRLNDERAPIVMIGSRRHEDDVQGRLFDPSNVHYDEKEAAKWVRIRLPALAEIDDPLGRKVDEPLWPEKFGFDHLNAMRHHPSDIVRLDFQTQYQCNPVPEEGKYFKKDWIQWYLTDELPKELNIYGTSDHAYRTKQKNDKNCLLCAGVDATGRVWLLPRMFWDRCETDRLVEELIGLMSEYDPQIWFAARDAISGSIGPFLARRQRERGITNWVDDSIVEGVDLQKRARSIQGLCAMKMVMFPKTDQWRAFVDELLAFPNGKHDDGVSALAMLGMGLRNMQNATVKPSIKRHEPGTFGYLKLMSGRDEQEERARRATAGW